MSIAYDNPICPEAPYVLLEDSQNPAKDISLFQSPHELIEAKNLSEIEPAFAAIEAALKAGHHVAGFMTYELGLALEPKLQKNLPANTPLLWFGVFKEKLLATQQMVTDWLDQEKNTKQASARDNDLTIKVHESFATYQQKFEKAQSAIRAGDIYQLNLTFKADIQGCTNPLALYEQFRESQPVSYAAIINTGQTIYLSASPELFIKNQAGKIETRPMKGTLERAPSSQEDKNFQQRLHRDEKSRAENLMIVDLMRNDISRIAATGSVTVEDLFKVETYHSLHQMISVIKAQLKPNLSLLDQFKALFPPGSITGAPKIRAMELIDELEEQPRGIYTGAIGHFSPDEHYCFNVAIRTLECTADGKASFGIGSGLVFDSKAKTEYDECLLKMQFLTNKRPTFSLIETIAYQPGEGLTYLSEHLERLEKSARYFLYDFDKQALEHLLNQATQPLTARTKFRVLLNKSGSISFTATEIAETPPDDIWPVTWAESPQDSTNPFLYHKTTNRQFYDEARTKAQAANGEIKEVLFYNEKEQVTEGSYTNIFVEQGGQLFTPPVSAGLLPGTLRENLLKNNKVREKTMRKQDISAADALYVGNSVRGLVKAQLV